MLDGYYNNNNKNWLYSKLIKENKIVQLKSFNIIHINMSLNLEIIFMYANKFKDLKSKLNHITCQPLGW